MGFLEITKLTKIFGGLAAVMEFNMNIDRGQIFGLIGPNGAGKSTVLNMIGGTLHPSRGEIIFNGKKVTKLSAHTRAEQGIGRVFQENLLFTSFTVLQNVLVGYHLQSPISPASIFLKTSGYRVREETLKSKSFPAFDPLLKLFKSKKITGVGLMEFESSIQFFLMALRNRHTCFINRDSVPKIFNQQNLL